MDKILKLLELINNNLKINCILANQGGDRPTLPFITLQVLDEGGDIPTETTSKMLPDHMAEYTLKTKLESMIQFNCLGKNAQESVETAKKLKNFFLFVSRQELWDNGIGVIDIGNIKDVTEPLEGVKYEHKRVLDVTIDYYDIVVKQIENMQSIEINKEIIRR